METSQLTTADTVDPVFNAPYVEVNELRDGPVPHRYVHGGFRGTDARFSFYFPPAARYQGRFHHNTYPLATSSDVGPFPIAFDVATGDLGYTLDSGGYYVQTNNGSAFSRSAADPSIAAYRVNAAAARYSRVLAAQLYGDHRPYGYLYGGSGGAYQTIGGAEHTAGVWDGFMPYVLGCNSAVPSFWTARMHALRVLRRRDRFPAVMDALNPGGSGDIYAGLDAEERAALEEATRMGFPPRGWYAHQTLGSGYFADIQGAIPPFDPTYVEDFWRQPGYLGADPAASIHAERFQFDTSIARVDGEGPARRIELSAAPDRPFVDAHLVLLSGAAAGRSAPIAHVDGRSVVLAGASDPAIAAAVQAGDRARIDNSWPLALQTYHRHQVPGPEEYAWNQFRDSSGEPRYPQRERLIGQVFAVSSVGTLLSGAIHGKMLLVQSLMDIDAVPWCADWYRSLVKQQTGAAFDDSFALWFIDHTQHDNPQSPLAHAHTVPLSGALQRGLHDLARWVEQGVKPSETRYQVEESQVLVPSQAAARGGVQPVIEFQANGAARAEAAVGEPVTFKATIEVPPGEGRVVAVDWDFEGAGDYPRRERLAAPAERVELAATHAYQRPGTYFPVLRAAAHRDADAAAGYALVQNLGRARVVVR